MSTLVVAGGTATLVGDGTWSPSGEWAVTFTSTDSSKVSAGGLSVVLTADLDPSFVGQTYAYTSTVYSTTPGMVTITSVSIDSGQTTSVSFGNDDALTVEASGSFDATVSVPATLVAGTTTTTDSGTKSGTWSILSSGQLTVEGA